jgi:hypothetical protein
LFDRRFNAVQRTPPPRAVLRDERGADEIVV